MNERKKAFPARFRNDILLIGVLLFLSLCLALYLFFFREKGDTVKVTVDGEVYGVYALSEDRTEEIRDGEDYNLLVIRNGRAYMESASCPDGICVSHHAIHRDGESIVCLPNRVVVTVSAEGGGAPDIIS